MRFYKVLDRDLSSFWGGNWNWKIGEWAPTIDCLIPCVSGYHVCQEDDLIYWIGPVIVECEIGSAIRVTDYWPKVVSNKCKVVRILDNWNEKTQRLFACDCLEKYTEDIKDKTIYGYSIESIIDIARNFANDGVETPELLEIRKLIGNLLLKLEFSSLRYTDEYDKANWAEEYVKLSLGAPFVNSLPWSIFEVLRSTKTNNKEEEFSEFSICCFMSRLIEYLSKEGNPAYVEDPVDDYVPSLNDEDALWLTNKLKEYLGI